jgi:hypothetical protein
MKKLHHSQITKKSEGQDAPGEALFAIVSHLRKIVNRNGLIHFVAIILCIYMMAAMTSCKDDIPEELTMLEVSRLFSPTDLDARVVNQTSVRLTWRAVKNASSYTIEVFENGELDFSGSPVRTRTNVSFDQLPVVIPGLAGETAYSIRVKAVGEAITESKWISARITTDPEQIFFPVNPEEIQATTVTLRWPAGEIATTIVLSPGEIVYNVTADDIAAGAANITGLTSETAYTARLLNVDKIRGTATFTTLLDLGGATPVYPEDNLLEAISAAANDEVLVLFPGEYTQHVGDILISKSITIKGLYPHNKPVVYNRFLLGEGIVDAVFADLEMVGNHASLETVHPQAFQFEPGTYNVNKVEITGCIIRNYSRALIYGASAILKVENLIIHNSIMSNIVNDGGDFIDFRSGHVAFLSITNSTFDRVAAAPRDFIRLDNSSGNFPGSHSSVLIDRCTFYQVSNTRRILYIRFNTNDITVRNTIFAGADENYTGYFSNQAATALPNCSRNNYYNAPAFLGGVNNGVFDLSGTHTTHNPGFVNPAAGNFKVNNEDLILFGIGDPRWL